MSPLIKHLLTINKKSDILDYKRQLKLKKSDFFDFLKKIMILSTLPGLPFLFFFITNFPCISVLHYSSYFILVLFITVHPR